MNTFYDLYTFIDVAEKNRKYPTNTAHGRRAALRIFEKELNEEELSSIEKIEQHIEEIFRQLVTHQGERFSIASLSTYKSRLLKIINDYKRYGTDPAKIQSWQAKLRTISKRKEPQDKIDSALDNQLDKDISIISNSLPTPVHKLAVALESGQQCLIESPREITTKDAKLLKNIIDSLTQP